MSWRRCVFVSTLAVATTMAGQSSATLVLYEPFNYTVGDTLGGTDPDGGGPTIGTPIGKTNPHLGGGTWYARGTQSNYQSPRDTVISGGNLSYTGLAPSLGNSVSYGSEIGSLEPYADTITLPSTVTSGSLYASFIIRIKSNANDPDELTTFRHSPASFVTDASTETVAGMALASQGGGVVNTPGSFWMRRDAFTPGVTNFSPSKSNTDGIGPGATGPSAGWQSSDSDFVEANQFGDVDGQAPPDFANSETWQTYFVVIKYEFDAMPLTDQQNDTVSLWMNPGVGTLGSATGEADASQAPNGNLGSYYAAVDAFGTGPRDASSIVSFALIGHRQNVNQSIAVDFDELRIGTTWADVTPNAASINANFDGVNGVDGADFLRWQRGFTGPGRLADGDANGDAAVNETDYLLWKLKYGATSAVPAGSTIPEPTGALLAAAGAVLLAGRRARRS